MADRTKIEWTDATWNPVTGCTKVSPGCAHCYAETVDHRFDHDKVGKLPWAFPASRGGRGVTLHPDRLEQPLHWKKPKKIFTCSMSDLFHEDVPNAFLVAVFMVMSQCPQHVFQILTKRPQRMFDFAKYFFAPTLTLGNPPVPWPANVWAGTSVENQHWADIRIPKLLQIPAQVRFVSAEPLLGSVDLEEWLCNGDCGVPWQECTGINWVIAGGESGPKARPSGSHWFERIRDDCQEAGVPFFFKQFGQWFPRSQWWGNPELKLPDDDEAYNDLYTPHNIKRVSYFPGEVEVFHKVGNKAAGAVLDGRKWREMPNL